MDRRGQRPYAETNQMPRSGQATRGRPWSETTVRPCSSWPSVHARVRGRSVRIDGSRLMIQMPSGMPMIVTSAIHAIATATPDAHQPMNNHQMNRTSRFGPRS
jgi:hypothetical protein